MGISSDLGVTKLGLVFIVFTLPWFTHHLVEDQDRQRKNTVFGILAVCWQCCVGFSPMNLH